MGPDLGLSASTHRFVYLYPGLVGLSLNRSTGLATLGTRARLAPVGWAGSRDGTSCRCCRPWTAVRDWHQGLPCRGTSSTQPRVYLVHLRNPPMSWTPTHTATFILMLRRTRVKTAVFTTRPWHPWTVSYEEPTGPTLPCRGVAMTTRPTGACLVLVTQVNMVRGPHPTEYCCGKLRAAPGRGRGCALSHPQPG